MLRGLESGLNLYPGHSAVITEHLTQCAVPMQRDFAFLRSLHQSILKNFLGAQTVATVNQMDLGAEVAEIERLLDSGVAAAYDGHFLIAIEEPVAGGAGAHAFTHECRFRGEAQILCRGPCGNDQGVTGVFSGALQCKRACRQVDVFYVIKDHAGLQPFNVLLHLLHELRPLQIVGPARPIFHLCGGC